jgi:hypothetical protein
MAAEPADVDRELNDDTHVANFMRRKFAKVLTTVIGNMPVLFCRVLSCISGALRLT